MIFVTMLTRCKNGQLRYTKAVDPFYCLKPKSYGPNSSKNHLFLYLCSHLPIFLSSSSSYNRIVTKILHVYLQLLKDGYKYKEDHLENLRQSIPNSLDLILYHGIKAKDSVLQFHLINSDLSQGIFSNLDVLSSSCGAHFGWSTCAGFPQSILPASFVIFQDFFTIFLKPSVGVLSQSQFADSVPENKQIWRNWLWGTSQNSEHNQTMQIWSTKLMDLPGIFSEFFLHFVGFLCMVDFLGQLSSPPSTFSECLTSSEIYGVQFQWTYKSLIFEIY